MTKAIQIKLLAGILAGILAVLGVIAGLLARGGRSVEVMSAKPVELTQQQQPQGPSDQEKQYRRFVAPTKKHRLIP